MSRLTSSFTCQLISVIITILIVHHSFTPGSNPIPFQQTLPTLILLLTAFMIMGPDRTYYVSRFIFSSFNFSVCPVWWTKIKLATRLLFTAR